MTDVADGTVAYAVVASLRERGIGDIVKTVIHGVYLSEDEAELERGRIEADLAYVGCRTTSFHYSVREVPFHG